MNAAEESCIGNDLWIVGLHPLWEVCQSFGGWGCDREMAGERYSVMDRTGKLEHFARHSTALAMAWFVSCQTHSPATVFRDDEPFARVEALVTDEG